MHIEHQTPTEGSITIDFAGLTAWLLPQRAIWLPAQRALLVADVHFGKETVFRRQGIAIPDGSSVSDLERLAALCARTVATDLWILGDLVHGALSDRLRKTLGDWLTALAPTRVHLIEGNHEQHDRTHLGRLPICRYRQHTIDAVTLRHAAAPAGPNKDACNYEIVGHQHPVARLALARHRVQRVPVFTVIGPRLTLPAFGNFTGGQLVDAATFDQCYGALGQRVFPVPGS